MKPSLGFLLVLGSIAIACSESSPTIAGPSSSAVPAATGEIAKRHDINGLISAVEKPFNPIAGASIVVTDGADQGRLVLSDANGAFSLTGLTPGPMALQITKAGYQPWYSKAWFLDGDVTIDPHLLPGPPMNATGILATARCADGTWSWAQRIGDACNFNGGVAYGACPGPFCKPQ